MDRTTGYLFAMVGIVALTGVLMLLIRYGGPSSASVTGNVVATAPSTDSPFASPTPVTLADDSASGVTRTLSILAIAFLLGIAAYLYLTPGA